MIEIENLELRQLKLVKMLNSVSSLLNHLNVATVLHQETPYVVSYYLHYQVFAVKYIEIEGVLHEFSAIDNVVEDVSTIIMNIKKLALKIYSEEDKTLEIDVRDEGEVTASDITHDSDVEVLNPELKIATVSKGGHLKIRLVANKGRGYALAEQNNTSDLPIGVIPVDSLYSPVERVNYTVENTRVGQSSDFDKLTLDVWTNGSITPQESVSLVAKIMTEHLNIFVGLTDEAQNAEIMIEKEEDQKKST